MNKEPVDLKGKTPIDITLKGIKSSVALNVAVFLLQPEPNAWRLAKAIIQNAPSWEVIEECLESAKSRGTCNEPNCEDCEKKKEIFDLSTQLLKQWYDAREQALNEKIDSFPA